MKRIRVAQNFYLDEFVDPYTYFTEDDHGLSLVDFRVIQLCQLLRSLYGSSISVNNWWSTAVKMNGDGKSNQEIVKYVEGSKLHKWSGYRSSRCTIGASKSAHKLGKAADPKGDEEAYLQIVKDNAALFYAFGLRRLEDIKITNGWLHMDIEERHHKKGFIRVINRTSHVYDIAA